MMKFGYRKGLCHINGFEFRKIKIDVDLYMFSPLNTIQPPFIWLQRYPERNL